jgi:UDP-2-acetamido-2-deoxy-ribo-hexuluronate aminotransferase
MIQMYDPKREYQSHKKEIDDSIQNILNHGLFINGPEVKALEPALAKFTGAKHAITCSNGTDALKVAMLALGVGPGDEVITVAHTWISTVEMISIINAVPVFCDICSDTFNMDHTKLESLITEKTKAIMPVSLYGQTPNIDAINEIANKHNIPVIEDGAQSFGAMYKGKRTGNLTTIGTTSFFPSKPLGCYGDGGAIFTNDDELNDRMRKIKNHGALKRFQHKLIGMNARLDSMQAAIINTKFQWYDETMDKRNACANYYTELLKDEQFIKTPFLAESCYSVWAQYSLLAPNKSSRDFIVKYFKENGVNAAIFYPAPLHLQECFQYLNYSLGDLPVTEDVCDRIFNLPCYGEFTREEQNKVVKILKDAINILTTEN